jgi:hypothetical protein
LEQGLLTPQSVAREYIEAWAQFVDFVNSLAKTVHDAAESDVFELTNPLDPQLNIGNVALGFAVGQCGPWDKLSDAVQKEIEKARAKAFAKLKKEQAALAKFGKGCVLVDAGRIYTVERDQNSSPNPGGGNGPNAPGTPQPKEFKMDAKASAITIGQPGTGVICVGGTADPAGANSVRVRLFDKDGNQVGAEQTAPIDSRCRWRACFPPSEPFTLPSGSYRVEAVQSTGGAALAHDFSVPNTN